MLRAPISRVWRAVSDAPEFGTWFKVAFEGDFVEGAHVRGRITYPGYELAEAAEGTALVITESGFEQLPPERRADALSMNDQGWAAQLENVSKHVADR